MKDIHDQTYYELLEVDPSASQEEILKAYNRARATYGNNSPALYSLFNKEEAQELLRLIDEAYAILSNQFKRKEYDVKTSGRAAHKEPPPAPNEKEVAYSMASSSLQPPKKPQPKEPLHQKISVAVQPKINPENLTPFGEYAMDAAFEEEIKKIDVFTGPLLQKIRIYKNVSLDQISEAIKVSRPYLMAIESNNFASLPATVFVRGFLVQIAKVLNLDANKVANTYLQTLKEAKGK